jgi:hypothetical protein
MSKQVSFEFKFESFYGLNQQTNTARGSKYDSASKKKNLTNGFIADIQLQSANMHRYYVRDFPLQSCSMAVCFTVPHFNVDVDNLFASIKPILDALVRAEILIGDSINVIKAIDGVSWCKSGNKKHGVKIQLNWS